MSHQSIDTYFISRKSKLLKDFDNLMKKGSTVLISQYGETFAETIVGETHQVCGRGQKRVDKIKN